MYEDEERWRNTPQGAILRGEDGQFYIKQQQEVDFHINGLAVALNSGKLVHYAELGAFLDVTTTFWQG